MLYNFNKLILIQYSKYTTENVEFSYEVVCCNMQGKLPVQEDINNIANTVDQKTNIDLPVRIRSMIEHAISTGSSAHSQAEKDIFRRFRYRRTAARDREDPNYVDYLVEFTLLNDNAFNSVGSTKDIFLDQIKARSKYEEIQKVWIKDSYGIEILTNTGCYAYSTTECKRLDYDIKSDSMPGQSLESILAINEIIRDTNGKYIVCRGFDYKFNDDYIEKKRGFIPSNILEATYTLKTNATHVPSYNVNGETLIQFDKLVETYKSDFTISLTYDDVVENMHRIY